MTSGNQRKRVAVLVSGRGSNMAALIAAAEAPNYPCHIVAVLSDRPQAAALQKAEQHTIPTWVIDRKAYEGPPAHEAALRTALLEARPDIVCLAGYMRLLSADFVARWQGQLINIHPSLLPAFPGLDTHQRVLDAGPRIHGCTVHFVTERMDEGPIIAQAAVPVRPGDDAESLAARVLKAEQRLYPHALRLVAEGKAKMEGERVVFAQGLLSEFSEMLISPGILRS